MGNINRHDLQNQIQGELLRLNIEFGALPAKLRGGKETVADLSSEEAEDILVFLYGLTTE